MLEHSMKTRLLLLTLFGVAGIACGASVELGSLATRAGISGSAGSFAPVLSADGRFVVFVSQARNLVTNDNHAPLLQVYRRDLTSNVTELVSVSTIGTGGANEGAYAPAVSADGRFVAFESVADNLVANDTNGVNDVFVRDMHSGVTLLVSAETNGVRSGNGPSRSPQISADGRYVGFESRASDLVAGDTNALDDIFLRDLVAGTSLLIYPAPVVHPHTRGNSSSPFLSVDGRVIAFENTRSNLSSSFLSGDIHVRKLNEPEAVFASAEVTNFLQSAAQSRSIFASIDPSGHRVAFFGTPQNQPTLGTLFVFDLPSSNLISIATNILASDPPPLSLGGEWTAYVQSNALFLHDIIHGTNLQVCGPAGLTNGFVRSALVLSTNSSQLLFSASATVNDAPVLLSFDRNTGVFTTISVNSNGTPTEVDLGSLPSLSDDGTRIAYVSSAADIVPSDYNQAANGVHI
jgi:Tol biopolymer transport system component